ncbi:F-box domain, Leucine-rich repeat domain, L domain-like protein [Artemisia annua]|uniref:F-box domain, Leucine-rich repeat domain, L domain-like protein n=1 Tax=Artemisia annua TaxID=35608 RepID=A0A2U1KSS9_ARTAN|nr:F-box domain, Leucine-rich repeat domain, L domain-like protein [Artemisia annua]
MKRLEATGEYTEDEINALARGGKLRGHIPGVGRVLPSRATSRPSMPAPNKSFKSTQRKVDFMMSLFRSDDKYSDMFKEFESGGASGSGGCGDDILASDNDLVQYYAHCKHLGFPIIIVEILLFSVQVWWVYYRLLVQAAPKIFFLGFPSDFVARDSSTNVDKSDERGNKYVEYTISRFSQQNVTSAHTLDIVTSLEHPTEVGIIDRCLDLVIKSGVKVLGISIINPSHGHQLLPMYDVSDKVLSASSLSYLTLINCKLASSLIGDAVKFKSMELLNLHYIQIDAEVFRHLITSCPILTELCVGNWCGVNRFYVYGLQNLELVRIRFWGDLERIDIEAPNLWYLCLDTEDTWAPSVNVASCRKLTKLDYYGYPSLTSGGLVNLSSDFPFIEELFLSPSDECNSLNLSSHSLRMFKLESNCDLEKIDINAPNLLLFICKGYRRYRSLKRDSLPSKARMECHPDDVVDSLWFQSLRRFLEKKIGFKELKLSMSAGLIDVEELTVIGLSPYELDHVELELYIEEVPVYESVLGAVLWCCRPESLSLELNSSCTDIDKWSHIIKFTYKKLLQQENQGKINVQIVLTSASKTKKHFSDLNSLLTASPCDQQAETITFIKKEVVKKEEDDQTVKRSMNMEMA